MKQIFNITTKPLFLLVALILATGCSEKQEKGGFSEYEFGDALAMTIKHHGEQDTSWTEPGQLYWDYSFVWNQDTFSTTMSENIPFHDCSGCIGPGINQSIWPPQKNGNITNWTEFLLSMVLANGTQSRDLNDFSVLWNEYPVIWEYSFDKTRQSHFLEAEVSFDHNPKQYF